MIWLLLACGEPEPAVDSTPPETVDTDDPLYDHGPMAEGIYGAMGDPWPFATEEQLATFERGKEVAERRFQLADGLGPAFNIAFCAGCYERPVTGGSAGLYRSFFLSAVKMDDGSFFAGESAGDAGGVVRLYYYGDDYDARPEVPEETNVIAQRNAIPFFGVGLLAEIEGEEILSREDPYDEDGDGITGLANYDQGFVGRFGRKSQTVSIENFIRGPLFNHLGITTDPLSEEQKASLPVDSSSLPSDTGDTAAFGKLVPSLRGLHGLAQAAASSGPTVDDDGVPDPELSTDDLFDLVSFAMLTAVPEPEELGETERWGLRLFDRAGCDACHTPRVMSPRGPLPVYSDLLLHDMGEDLADGLEQGYATGSEFRTQPLWGIGPVGPYLHDGRAQTIDEAIRMHGGEGQASSNRYVALTTEEQEAIVAFLLSLGGRSQHTDGLLPPGEPVPEAGAYGGPWRELDADEAERFERGRAVFDHDFGFSDGVGTPRFNGDSCRACHFEPGIAGAGPRGVNVVRHGLQNDDGGFVPPSVGTILHRMTALSTGHANAPQAEATIFELRQTPHLYGLGRIEAISETDIVGGADPYDSDGDGISGKPSWTDGGQLGRFGWKGQVPSVEEFVRDAVSAELGMTLSYEEGLTFGMLHDNDDVPDPEFADEDADSLVDFLQLLAPPPRQGEHAEGEAVFDEVGCTSCHTPSFETADGPVALYSDLLLHEILPEGALGIEEASATMREFRTPPLWGLSQTAPYLHDGSADTTLEAIEAHDGEATAVRDAFAALEDDDQAALLAFLETL